MHRRLLKKGRRERKAKKIMKARTDDDQNSIRRANILSWRIKSLIVMLKSKRSKILRLSE
jgi:hypothetical protein